MHSEFLSALSVGVHTLSINSESGSATTGFVIEKAPLEPSPTVEPSPTDAPSIVAASSVVTATPTPTTAPEETNTKTGDVSRRNTNNTSEIQKENQISNSFNGRVLPDEPPAYCYVLI